MEGGAAKAKGFETEPIRTKKAITAYQVQLTHYTAGVTGNLEVAREIVQEAFMRFWKADDNKVSEELEKAWLYRVCRNMAIDNKRRQGVVIAVGDVTELEAYSSESPRQDSEQEFDQLTAVLNQLQRLTANQQEVIRLRFQHDMSYKEISKVTGHSVSNVGVIIHDAMKKLKILLATDESSPENAGNS